MQSFKRDQRVRVASDYEDGRLHGKVGTVHRIRTDGGAWVEMDDPLPDDLCRFPADDPRGKHVQLYPEECERVA